MPRYTPLRKGITIIHGRNVGDSPFSTRVHANDSTFSFGDDQPEWNFVSRLRFRGNDSCNLSQFRTRTVSFLLYKMRRNGSAGASLGRLNNFSTFYGGTDKSDGRIVARMQVPVTKRTNVTSSNKTFIASAFSFLISLLPLYPLETIDGRCVVEISFALRLPLLLTV